MIFNSFESLTESKESWHYKFFILFRFWFASTFRVIIRIFRRIPLTLALFAVILALGILTGTVLIDLWPFLIQHFGWNLTALKEGNFYILWPLLFFATTPGLVLPMMLGLVLGAGALEYFYGTKLTAIIFFIIGPLACLINTLILWPGFILGNNFIRGYLSTPDMGSSAASLACWGVFLSIEKSRIRKITLGLTFLALFLFFTSPQNNDPAHLTALALGTGTGWLIRSRLHSIVPVWKKKKVNPEQSQEILEQAS